MFGRNRNVFEISSRIEDRFALEQQVSNLRKTTDSVREKEEVAAEMWKSWAAVDDVPWYGAYL